MLTPKPWSYFTIFRDFRCISYIPVTLTLDTCNSLILRTFDTRVLMKIDGGDNIIFFLFIG